MEHKDDRQKREIKVISQTSKATSKWGDRYNAQNLDNGQISWVNMREYRNFRLIPEEEEVLLGEFNEGRIMESKMEEINNWERNGVFEEVKNQGQRTINTHWAVTEKMKEGKVICKVRLVTQGFEVTLYICQSVN